MLDNIQ